MMLYNRKKYFSTNTGKIMGLTYQFEGNNFQVISFDDLQDHRVKIAYIFDGESRESVVENRKGLLPFLANLLGLDADDSIDKKYFKDAYVY